MLTYPKSTMRVRRMPMHLSSGHVTLMPGKFSPPPFYPSFPNFPQSDLGRRADSRWALPQISSIFMFLCFCIFCAVIIYLQYYNKRWFDNSKSSKQTLSNRAVQDLMFLVLPRAGDVLDGFFIDGNIVISADRQEWTQRFCTISFSWVVLLLLQTVILNGFCRCWTDYFQWV